MSVFSVGVFFSQKLFQINNNKKQKTVCSIRSTASKENRQKSKCFNTLPIFSSLFRILSFFLFVHSLSSFHHCCYFDYFEYRLLIFWEPHAFLYAYKSNSNVCWCERITRKIENNLKLNEIGYCVAFMFCTHNKWTISSFIQSAFFFVLFCSIFFHSFSFFFIQLFQLMIFNRIPMIFLIVLFVL